MFVRQIKISIIVIIYAILPTIVRFSLSLFFCVELDPNESWLGDDLEVRCWTISHTKWAMMTGLPSILVWIIGSQLWGLFLLFRNRKKLEDEEIQKSYYILY